MLHGVGVAGVGGELFLAHGGLVGDGEGGGDRLRRSPCAGPHERADAHALPGHERPGRQEALAGAGGVRLQAPGVHAGARPDDTHVRDLCARLPRKLIWVSGEASGVPGSGETVTALAAAAATSALSPNATEAEDGSLSPQEENATASSAAASTGVATLNAGAPRERRRGSAPREGRRRPARVRAAGALLHGSAGFDRHGHRAAADVNGLEVPITRPSAASACTSKLV